MIVALLLLVVLILLFGAAAVKGWIKSAAMLVVFGVLFLFALGFIASKYNQYQESKKHAQLVQMAERDTLQMVANAAGKSVSALVDIVTYDTDDFFMCGTIAGTRGFGGNDGRQRFLSNGGGITEFEKPGAASAFNERVALYCTFDRERAIMGQ